VKKIKYGRQIGYGLAGLAIGIIVYVMLVSNIPSAVEARSSLIEFVTQKEEPTSEYVLDDENYNGEVVPFLKHGGYRVSPAQFIQYEKNETVRFGKVNPTFYYVKEIYQKMVNNLSLSYLVNPFNLVIARVGIVITKIIMQQEEMS